MLTLHRKRTERWFHGPVGRSPGAHGSYRKTVLLGGAGGLLSGPHGILGSAGSGHQGALDGDVDYREAAPVVGVGQTWVSRG